MSRKRGVPIGSAWSRSDGRGTVRTGGRQEQGSQRRAEPVAAVRLATGLVATRLEDGRGAPPGPNS